MLGLNDQVQLNNTVKSGRIYIDLYLYISLQSKQITLNKKRKSISTKTLGRRIAAVVT